MNWRTVLTWVWALLPAVTFGISSPLVFAFAAARRFNALTLTLAVIFTGLFTVFATVPDEHPLEDASIFICWLVGGGLALGMRRYVFDRTVDHEVDRRHDAARASANNKALLAGAQRRRELRAEARAMVGRDPALAIELGIGRPDLGRGFDDGGLIDLNSAPVELLAKMSGLGGDRAPALVRVREQTGPFISVEDAVIRSDLPPHLVEVISEYAVFR